MFRFIRNERTWVLSFANGYPIVFVIFIQIKRLSWFNRRINIYCMVFIIGIETVRNIIVNDRTADSRCVSLRLVLWSFRFIDNLLKTKKNKNIHLSFFPFFRDY